MKISLVKIIVLAVTVYSCFATAAGGEIGNGYTIYNNQIAEFSLAYPNTWTYLTAEKSVRFEKETIAAQQERSRFTVLDRKIATIKGVEDLLAHLQFFHPNLTWSRTSISGFPAYKSTQGDEGLIYALRESERIISIRYKYSNEASDLEEIQNMIGSLEIR